MNSQTKKTKYNCLQEFDDSIINGGFTKSPNEILFDKKVKPMSLRVYLAIASLTEEKKNDFQPVIIQNKLGIKWDAFMKAMKNLSDCGYAKIEIKAEVTGYNYYYYSIASCKKFLLKSEPIKKEIPKQMDYDNALENTLVEFLKKQIEYSLENREIIIQKTLERINELTK